MDIKLKVPESSRIILLSEEELNDYTNAIIVTATFLPEILATERPINEIATLLSLHKRLNDSTKEIYTTISVIKSYKDQLLLELKD